mmetsp:Transcript_22293/g.25813  ORF Transcript_22293/g.25813 Transcript_22293/m.25813 type:complete len:195 (-) Transcript_22293:310-894(-)
MDNIESLMGNMSIQKPKIHKKEHQPPSKQASLSKGGSKSLKGVGFTSPKSPMFRPQKSPNDLMPEILLPVSEMDSEENEPTDDRDLVEMEYYANRKKKVFSCPNGPTLDIWVGNSSKGTYGIEIIEENDDDLFTLDEVDTSTKRKDAAKPTGESKFSKKNDFNRIRSQSENITACTIFKFLETSMMNQKRLLLE